MSNYIKNLFVGEIYPDETICGCIDIFENAWPEPQKTIDLIENDHSLKFYKSTTLGKTTNIRKNKNLNITQEALESENLNLQNMHNQFNFLLLASTVPYIKKHNISQLYHEDYILLSYEDSEFYKTHYDGMTSTGRSVSAICYLNNDYEGGEIEFTNFKVKIKPEPGMLILFPSNYAYAHSAHPILSGKKYAIVTWLHDQFGGYGNVTNA